MKKLIILTCVLLVSTLTTYAQQNQTLHQRVAVNFIQAESGEEARGGTKTLLLFLSINHCQSQRE